MAGWASLDHLISEERTQLLQEGAIPAAVDAAAEKARQLLASHASEQEIWRCFADIPRRADFPFNEPSDLESIRAVRPASRPTFSRALSDAQLRDQLHGAWLGRCVGCALGKPVEWFMGAHNGVPSWQRMKKYLTAISPSEWPLRDYIPEHSPAEPQVGGVGCQPSTREHIAFMETDDDIRYTVLGQMILRQFGANFFSADVAHAWLLHLPYVHVCTAETQAYRNMVIASAPLREDMSRARAAEIDRTTDWHYIAHHFNPYREWIGAQIRVDSYGYAAPGNPELAAEFAWRDARISHVKNGIYGAMFCAAMIAAAFATDDPLAIIQTGLSQIPATSRLYHEMNQVIAICDKYDRRAEAFEQVITDIYALLGHYNPVHTNNNAALCVAALLLSGGDFHRGITLAVMGGWDTDCNGATVGSIVGAMAGASRVPPHWTARLNDTLNSEIPGYHPIAISRCAEYSLEIAKACAATTSAHA